jgi:hypothetical protein
MTPPDRPEVDTNDPTAFSFWDGQRLQLNDGREMKVVSGQTTPPRPPAVSTEPK